MKEGLFQFILLRQCCQARHRAFQRPVVDTVYQPEKPRCSESHSGYRQDMVILLKFVHESDVVLYRAFGKDVESPLRFIHPVAHFHQVVVDVVPVPLVFRDIYGDILEVTYHSARKNVEKLVDAGILRRFGKTQHPKLICAKDILDALASRTEVGGVGGGG